MSARGQRGYETRILESDDGVRFRKILSVERETVGLRGFERPALIIDPDTGAFRLYTCGSPADEPTGLWSIFGFHPVDDLRELDPSSMRCVLPPINAGIPGMDAGYKEPVITHDGRMWHMHVIAYDFTKRTCHFTSADGKRWTSGPANPVLGVGGWHNFDTRPAPVGFFFVYEGSNAGWDDPGYNIATGLAYTFDMSRIIDLTPESPILRSPMPGRVRAWRYSCWLPVGDEIHVYAEMTCADDTNEIRRFVLPARGLERA